MRVSRVMALCWGPVRVSIVEGGKCMHTDSRLLAAHDEVGMVLRHGTRRESKVRLPDLRVLVGVARACVAEYKVSVHWY